MKKTYAKRNYKKTNKSIVKTVNSILQKRVENKEHDLFGDSALTGGTYYTALLNGLGQGTGDFARIGNEVINQRLQVKCTITFPDAVNECRVIVFWDKQANSAIPINSTLFTFTADPVHSFFNPDSKGRLQILKDVLVSGGAQGPVSKSFNWSFPLRNKRTLYNGVTNAIESVVTNALYIMTINDSLAVPNPQFDWISRLTYTDM